MERRRINTTVGSLVSAIIIVAFIATGFVTMFSEMFFGTRIEPPQAWQAAMLSLASTALGFLAGNRRASDSNREIIDRMNMRE